MKHTLKAISSEMVIDDKLREELGDDVLFEEAVENMRTVYRQQCGQLPVGQGARFHIEMHTAWPPKGGIPMSEVKANLVSGFSEAKNPGDYWFTKRDGVEWRLMFMCPCGCGSIGGAALGDGGWKWNGDRDKPTLRPSLLRSGGGPEACTYHGWLTDGVFRSC